MINTHELIEFVDMLNEMRFGNLSETSIAKFKSLSRAPEYEDGIAPTALCALVITISLIESWSYSNVLPGTLVGKTLRRPTRRKSIESAMLRPMCIRRMTQVPFTRRIKELRCYRISWLLPKSPLRSAHRYEAVAMIVAEVTAHPPSQVMLIKNMDDTLVNGSMGTVVGFHAREMDDPMYSGAPQSGSSGSTAKKYPMVEFTSGRTFLAVPEMWKVELPNGEPQVVRHQVSRPSHLLPFLVSSYVLRFL